MYTCHRLAKDQIMKNIHGYPSYLLIYRAPDIHGVPTLTCEGALGLVDGRLAARALLDVVGGRHPRSGAKQRRLEQPHTRSPQSSSPDQVIRGDSCPLSKGVPFLQHCSDLTPWNKVYSLIWSECLDSPPPRHNATESLENPSCCPSGLKLAAVIARFTLDFRIEDEDRS